MQSFGLSPQLLAACDSGACILAPNNRVAHWLKLAHAHHCQAQGLRAWRTPDIQSFDDFVLRLWRLHAQGDERVLAVEQARVLWARLIDCSPWAESLLSVSAAASSSFRSWERLQAWRITREQLADFVARSDNMEAQALLEWSDTFAAACLERRWLPTQWLATRLLRTPIACESLRIVTWTAPHLPIQRAALEHLVGCGARWDSLEPDSIRGSTEVRSFATPASELRAIAGWTRERLLAGDRSIAIIIPTVSEAADGVRRALAETLAQDVRVLDERTESSQSQLNGIVAVAGYRSLGDFPIVTAAIDLLRLAAGRVTRATMGSVLRSPFTRAGLSEAAPRALTDLRLRAHTREHFELAVLEQIASANNCSVFAQCLSQVRAGLVNVPTRGLPSDFVAHFTRIWSDFGWPGERLPNSEEQQTIGRLQQALAEFGGLDELLEPGSFIQAVRDFEVLVRDIHFEPRSAPAPVLVIDAESCGGMRFDALWMAAVDDIHWPPPPNIDPFIPLQLQIRAGMHGATPQSSRERAAGRFEALLCAADAVVLSWAAQSDDVENLPSPWLAALGPVQAMDSPAYLTYAERTFADRPALEVHAEPCAPKFIAAGARGGARIFELQSQCPFRAFAELRLGAHPLEEITSSITAKDRGVLIHGALAEIWQVLGGTEGLRQRSRDELEVLVRTALTRNSQRLLQGATAQRVRMLQIEQDLAAERIVELLRIDSMRNEFRVLGRPESRETVAVGPLRFELQLDRMDAVKDEQGRERRIIIDYKTGSHAKSASWFDERPDQPQLPLYAVTHPDDLAAVSFAMLGAKHVGYLGVARDGDLLSGVAAYDGRKLPPAEDSWDALLRHWQMVVNRLADEFARGRAGVTPAPSACQYCHLHMVCRVGAVHASDGAEDES